MATTGPDSVISDGEIVARWDSGERAASIARDVGLTRERIRQRLERNGRSGINPNAVPTSREIVTAAETSDTRAELAEDLEITVGALLKALQQHGIKEEVDALLKANRTIRTQRSRTAERGPYVSRLRDLARKVGHTPTTPELEAEGIFHASLARVFGSAPEAMEAAGLHPNVRGHDPLPLPPDFDEFEAPTADLDELAARVDRLLGRKEQIDPPSGNPSPATRATTSKAYVRDPAVVAWVLQNAAGHCEACGAPGYETPRTKHYLEVHHVKPLSEGGPDVIANAVAVCETCHGKLHRWVHRERLLERVRMNTSRIK